MGQGHLRVSIDHVPNRRSSVEWLTCVLYVCYGVLYRKAGHPPPPKDSHIEQHLALLAAYGGSTFNRTCSRKTFEHKGRSMQTEDMLAFVPEVFTDVFGGEETRSEEAAEFFRGDDADYIQ